MDSAGRYRVDAPIAHGGMGEVYRARMTTTTGLDKLVALKVIRSDLVADAAFVELFVREAKVAIGMSHGNIVQAFDVGRVGERWFIAMELVDGVDLGTILRSRGKPLELAHALTIAVEALKGLDYAHRRRDESGRPLGIVHRDISPQNILVSREGEVKIADFGVAKSGYASDEESAVRGKRAYMAPEQRAAGAVDAKADLYSVGVVLVEALSGRGVIDDDRAFDQAVRERLGDRPAALIEIVLRATARDPSARFPSAAAMRQAIERLALAEGLMLSTADLSDLAHDVDDAQSEGAQTAQSSIVRTSQPITQGNFDLRLGMELERVGRDEEVSVFMTRAAEPTARSRRGVWIASAFVILALGSLPFAFAFWPPAERSEDASHGTVAPVAPPAEPVPEIAAPMIEAPEEPPREPIATESPPIVPMREPAMRERHVAGEHARISIASEPWAEVYVDGTRVGRTALHEHRVAPGRHRIVLRNPAGMLEHAFTVNLDPGQSARYSIDLARLGTE